MADAPRRDGDDSAPGHDRALDPLQDTMPWVPSDDPVLKQLRDWRSELGEKTPTDVDSGPSQMSQSAEQPSEQRREPTTSRNQGAPRSERDPRRRVDRNQGTQPVRSRPEFDERPPASASWPLAGLVRRRPEPIIEDEPRAPRHMSVPSGRHAAWDVIGSDEPLTPTEVAAASARTVAFPALDLVEPVDPADIEYAIEVTDLRRTFKDFVAVDGVSFKVPAGKILALLGPNGAGKTTTVNMLCTLLKPTSGTVTVNGWDVVDDAAKVRESVMLTGQFAALDESLTGRENLILFGRLMGLTKRAAKQRATELLQAFALELAADRKVGQYSGGMRRRIDIACGLVTEPKIVFLDEPTTGLDPRSRQDVWTLVERMRDSGITVLLTTQYLEEADILSDNIVVIDKGKVIAEGTSDDLKSATGAAYCEVTPAHPAYLPRLRAKLADMLGSTTAGEAPDSLAVPAPNGPETLAEVIRRTEAARIPLADIALRRPSLDEVFMALTGEDEKS